MSKFTFNIETQTTPAAEYTNYRGSQEEKAKEFNAERILVWNDCFGHAENLPKYVKNAIEAAGYEALLIGSSRYKYSKFALVKAQD